MKQDTVEKVVEKAQAAVADEDSRLHDVLARAPVGVAIFMGPELRYVFANEEYRKLFGHRKLIGEPLISVIPDIEPSLLAIIRKTAFEGVPYAATELPVLRSWGGTEPATKYLNVTYEPVLDNGGKPHGLTAFVYDVTEQVALRQAAAQQAQLLALNQAKDEFISLASHQLRTPATGVKQYLGMLLQGFAGPLTDEQELFIQTAYESNERQITIVNDLLQVARLDAGKVVLKYKKTDLVRLIKNILNESASKFNERGQQVIFQAQEPRITARLDSDRIRMALDNILDNAAKYTPSGKTVRIAVTIRKEHVVVTVTDQGIGVAAENISKLFQKFSRLEDPMAQGVEGSGLGLYWAKKIIDLHHGTIRVRSKVGRGTTFTINLPLAGER